MKKSLLYLFIFLTFVSCSNNINKSKAIPTLKKISNWDEYNALGVLSIDNSNEDFFHAKLIGQKMDKSIENISFISDLAIIEQSFNLSYYESYRRYIIMQFSYDSSFSTNGYNTNNPFYLLDTKTGYLYNLHDFCPYVFDENGDTLLALKGKMLTTISVIDDELIVKEIFDNSNFTLCGRAIDKYNNIYLKTLDNFEPFCTGFNLMIDLNGTLKKINTNNFKGMTDLFYTKDGHYNEKGMIENTYPIPNNKFYSVGGNHFSFRKNRKDTLIKKILNTEYYYKLTLGNGSLFYIYKLTYINDTGTDYTLEQITIPTQSNNLNSNNFAITNNKVYILEDNKLYSFDFVEKQKTDVFGDNYFIVSIDNSYFKTVKFSGYKSNLEKYSGYIDCNDQIVEGSDPHKIRKLDFISEN